MMPGMMTGPSRFADHLRRGKTIRQIQPIIARLFAIRKQRLRFTRLPQEFLTILTKRKDREQTAMRAGSRQLEHRPLRESSRQVEEELARAMPAMSVEQKSRDTFLRQ